MNNFGLFSYTRLIQVPGCTHTVGTPASGADYLPAYPVFTPEKDWPGSKFTCNFALA